MLGAMRHEVWALLMVSQETQEALTDFFVSTEGFNRSKVRRNLHVTLYHARRKMNSVAEEEREVSIVTSLANWRFMVMAPGGENPRANIDTPNRSIGLRIQRNSEGGIRILKERARYTALETSAVLGRRPPSDTRRSAFGARHYQPHITVLRPGAGHSAKLSDHGARLREQPFPICFDRVVVRTKQIEGDS